MQMMLAHKQSELDRMLKRASSSNTQLQASFQVAAARLAKADRQLSQQAMQYWPYMPAKLQKYRWVGRPTRGPGCRTCIYRAGEDL